MLSRSFDTLLLRFANASPQLLRTTQTGTSGFDTFNAIVLDASDSAVCVGLSNGVWPGFTSDGGADFYVSVNPTAP